MKSMVILIFLLSLIAIAFADDQITITTYYPSPNGVYNQLNSRHLTLSNTTQNTNFVLEIAGKNAAASGFGVDQTVGIYPTSSTDSAGIVFTQSKADLDNLATNNDCAGIGIGNLAGHFGDAVTPGDLGIFMRKGKDIHLVGRQSGACAPGTCAPTRMVIKNSGNVGIGMVSPVAHLEVGGNVQGLMQQLIYQDIDDTVGLSIRRNATSTYPHAMLQFCNEDTGLLCSYVHQDRTIGGLSLTAGNNPNSPEVYINAAGNVGLKTTSPASRLDLGGGCMTGSICSDIGLKKNIIPILQGNPYLAKIMKLRAVSFEWKNAKDRKRYVGLIAQDVEKIFPEVVTTSDSNDRQKGLYPIGLEAVLIEAIKAQQKEIEALKQEVNILKAKVRNKLN